MSPEPQSAIPEIPRLLTVAEAADLMHVSKDRFYDYCRRGLVPVKRLGGRIFVPEAAFLAWLATPDAPLPMPRAR